MLGTLTGILAAALIVHLVASLKAIALIAVAFAASARLGLALKPALGFMGFTVFFMLNIDVALQGEAIPAHLLSTRLDSAVKKQRHPKFTVKIRKRVLASPVLLVRASVRRSERFRSP